MINNWPRTIYSIMNAMMALVFLVLSGSLWAIPTRIIVNSGFESPNLATECTGAGNGYINSEQFDGWDTTHSARTGNTCSSGDGRPIELWGPAAKNPGGIAPAFGDQFVELNAFEESFLYQNICMINNETVSYSYYHRRRGSGTETTRAKLTTTSGGLITQSVDHDVSDDNWNEHTGTLINTGATGEVRFGFETIGGGGSGNFIDNVTVGLRALVEIKGFSQSAAAEGGSDVYLEIYISGRLDALATVILDLKGSSTASPGADFTVATGAINRGSITNFDNSGRVTLSLPAGDYDPNQGSGPEAGLIQIPISLLADSLFETNKTLIYETASVSGGGGSGRDLQYSDADCNSQTRVETSTLTITESSAEPSLTIEKTASRKSASIGDIIQYQLVLSNSTTTSVVNVDVQDRLPVGFKLLDNTARKINEITGKTEPVSHEGTGTVQLEGIDMAQGTSTTILYSVVVGSGVKPGRKINRAQIISSITGNLISNEATASVEVVPDPLFEASTIIGKVFHDKNNNGYQDEGESGLAGVRLATVAGEWITTDAVGRFSYPGLNTSASGRGRNFILKLDVRSLPDGYSLRSSNPAILRVTEGMIHKVNFVTLKTENKGSQCQGGSSDTVVDADGCKMSE